MRTKFFVFNPSFVGDARFWPPSSGFGSSAAFFSFFTDRPSGDSAAGAAGAMMAAVAVLVPQILIRLGGILFLGIAALLVAPAYIATKQE
jgi:hypothetical protein